MRFENIDNIIVFGGSERVVNLLSAAGNIGKHVVSGARYLDALIPPVNCTLASLLEANGIDYYAVEDINAFAIQDLLTDDTLGISLGAPWIFKDEFIRKFSGKLLNGHGAKLPTNRGAGDYSWQMMQGLNFGYHLLHQIDTGIDTGDIVYCSEFMFPPDCRTPAEYKKHFVDEEVAFFEGFFAKVREGHDFRIMPQQESFSTYFPRLSTVHHGFINWNWSSQDIERFICAFDDPYPGASTFYGDKRVFIKQVRRDTRDGEFHPFMSGLVYRKLDGFVYVASRDGSIVICDLHDESSKDMYSEIKLGHRFVTPKRCLDEALAYVAVYDTKGLRKRRKTK